MTDNEAPDVPSVQFIKVECGLCDISLVHTGTKWDHVIEPSVSWHRPDPRPVGTRPVIPSE